MDRQDLKYALRDLMDQINFGLMPFLDSGLTDGIINLIVQDCHKICKQDDLSTLVPGLSSSTQGDVMKILDEIFNFSPRADSING